MSAIGKPDSSQLTNIKIEGFIGAAQHPFDWDYTNVPRHTWTVTRRQLSPQSPHVLIGERRILKAYETIVCLASPEYGHTCSISINCFARMIVSMLTMASGQTPPLASWANTKRQMLKIVQQEILCLMEVLKWV